MKLLDSETLQNIIDLRDGLDEGDENEELISSIDYIVARFTDMQVSVTLSYSLCCLVTLWHEGCSLELI